MKKKLHYLCLCGALMLPLGSAAQLALDETQVPENADNEPAPVHPVPSERQLLWNETEFYGFFHYGMNTYTGNVSNSSNYGIQTNIPKMFGEAARKLGMKYGFYVSPWDRNSRDYGTQDYIDRVFIKQCEELAQYGDDQFEMWFDGANGGDGYYGGRNTTVNIDRYVYYDVPNLRYKVHSLAKNCVMWGVGG